MADIEKVKRGLKHCSDRSRCNDGCPYSNIIKDQNEGMDSCTTQLASDALSVIEFLQAENKIITENIIELDEQRGEFAMRLEKLRLENERLKAEAEKAFISGQNNMLEAQANGR